MNDDKSVEAFKKEFDKLWGIFRQMAWPLEYIESGIINKDDALKLFEQAFLSREKQLQEIAEEPEQTMNSSQPTSSYLCSQCHGLGTIDDDLGQERICLACDGTGYLSDDNDE